MSALVINSGRDYIHDNTSTATTISCPTIISTPFFTLDDWEERRIKREKLERESNLVHLQEKRKDLFR